MIHIFSRTPPYYKGGLEQFNYVMCKAFKKHGINNNGIKYTLDYFINTFIYYTVLVINALKQKRNANVIIQYGSFYDIIAVSILSKIFRYVVCIAHVGPMWFHLKNKRLKAISIYILQNMCNRLYIISKEQEVIFADVKHKKRINTIIDDTFFLKQQIINKKVDNYFFYYGRLSRDKGIENLIKGFAEIYGETDKYLYLAGEFEKLKYKSNIEKQIQKYNISHKIKFLGFIENKEHLIELIDNCIAVIYPSFYDAFPLTVIEAMSRGKICLCSNISETKYFVNDNRLLFDPSNFIEFKQKWSGLSRVKISKSKLKQEAKIFHPSLLIDVIKSDGFI